MTLELLHVCYAGLLTKFELFVISCLVVNYNSDEVMQCVILNARQNFSHTLHPLINIVWPDNYAFVLCLIALLSVVIKFLRDVVLLNACMMGQLTVFSDCGLMILTMRLQQRYLECNTTLLSIISRWRSLKITGNIHVIFHRRFQELFFSHHIQYRYVYESA